VDAVLMAVGLSLLAGLGTGFGGLIAVVRKPGQRVAGLLMGLAAGVMITLSFLELVNKAWQASGYLVTTLGFAAGALLMFLVDSLAPHIRFAEKERIEAVGESTENAGRLRIQKGRPGALVRKAGDLRYETHSAFG